MKKNLTTTQDFVEVEITPVMYQNAKRRADAQGELRKSITHGKSNIYGFLGEEIFHKMFPRAIRTNTESFDFVLNGNTIDIKSKRCKHKPRLDFECSVALVTKLQDTDFYFFCRVREDCQVGWALGWMTAKAYKAASVKKYKGELDPSNQMTFLCDCLNLEIGKLWHIEALTVLDEVQAQRKKSA